MSLEWMTQLDQKITAMRLWIKDEIKHIDKRLDDIDKRGISARSPNEMALSARIGALEDILASATVEHRLDTEKAGWVPVCSRCGSAIRRSCNFLKLTVNKINIDEHHFCGEVCLEKWLGGERPT